MNQTEPFMPLAELFFNSYKALRQVGFAEDAAQELLPLFVSIILDNDEDDDEDELDQLLR